MSKTNKVPTNDPYEYAELQAKYLSSLKRYGELQDEHIALLKAIIKENEEAARSNT